MRIYFKIVEEKEGELHTLFHGISGSRKLPLNIWIEAEVKNNVMDGHGTKYTSGIHIIDGYENALEYLKKFRRNDRIIVKCYAKDLKRKMHSKSYVYLANEVKIIK